MFTYARSRFPGKVPNFIINATDLQFILQALPQNPWKPKTAPTSGSPSAGRLRHTLSAVAE